jgi:hypothetical protein
MLLREITTVYYEQLTKQIHPVVKMQNAECILLMLTSGI